MTPANIAKIVDRAVSAERRAARLQKALEEIRANHVGTDAAKIAHGALRI